MDDTIPSLKTLFRRGICRRCPHCGRGALFKRLLKLHDHCSVCGFQLEKAPGDTWGLWVAFDRLLIGVPILLFLIGFMPRDPSIFLYWCFAVVLILLGTAQHRYGLAVAADYLSRRKTNDADDYFPEIPDSATDSKSD